MTNLPAEDCPRKCVASLGATALRRLSMTEPLPLARDERGFAGLSAKVQAEAKPLVIVVDDDEAVRLSICELLESVGIDSAAFGSTRELLEADVLHRPGCMILDVRMPGLSGLDFQSQLAAQGIPTSIIFLTGHGDIPMTVQAMKAGAIEFLTKPARDQTLLDAVNRAIAADQAKRGDAQTARENATLYQSMTPRERQVMRSVVQGALNKQIAYELGITEVTVKLHRSSLMKKMRTPFVTHLVRAWQSLPAPLRDELPV
jgi:FixJ family two-component response regulator